MKPKLFKGGIAIDKRGSVSFNNNLITVPTLLIL